MNQFNLSGRTALITGGSKGIGKALARGLAEAGCNVIINSRNQAELEAALVDILAGTSATGTCIAADLLKRSESERLAKESLAWAGGTVDIFCNNAGFSFRSPADKVVDEEWDQVMELNVNAGMAIGRALIPGTAFLAL
jgi:short-subunit dehydrogenase